MKVTAKVTATLLIILGLSLPCPRANCFSVQDGSWTDPATWGGLPCSPGVADTVTIQHIVSGDFAGMLTIDRLLVPSGGELNMVAGSRIIQLNDTVGPLPLDGILRPANGTEIHFNQASGLARISLGTTGRILSDNVDLGPLRTVNAFAFSPTSGVCVAGENWTVTLDDVSGVAIGQTAKFHAGGTAGRGAVEGMAYEVMDLSGNDLTLCPQLPDANSRGQRFTAHLPSSAGTMPDAGALEPTRRPAAGDRLLVFEPWWIKRTGNVDWSVTSSSLVAPSELIGGDFSGSAELSFQCDAAASRFVLAHSNFHDGFFSSAGVRFAANQAGGGCDRVLAAWNVFHDTELGDFQAHLIVHNNFAGAVGGGAFVGNTFYRTQHNNIGINSSAEVDPVRRHSVEYNLAFDIGRSGSGECEFIEMDRSENAVVRFNVGWKLSPGCGCIRAKGDNVGNLYGYNYCQGAGRGGLEIGSLADIQKDNVLINNYVEDSGEAAEFGISLSGYAASYNIARNCRNSTCYDVILAEGNIADARDHPANHTGFRTDDMAPGSTSENETRRWRNNVCVNIGEAKINSCMVAEVTGGESETDVFDLEWTHNVFFMNDAPSFGYRLRQRFPAAASATADLFDNICVGDAGQPSQWCFTGGSRPGTSVTVDGLTHWNTEATNGQPDTLGDVHQRDPLLVDNATDWNLQPASLEWTAGSVPGGSPIGVRARHFEDSLFPTFLRDVMTSYPDVINEASNDEDLDGWLEFLANDPDSPDNCPESTNPDQQDSDADGRGDACDCSDSDPGIADPVSIIAGVGFDTLDPDLLIWDPDPQAQVYYVYRGSRPAGLPFAYDHDCLDSAGTTATQLVDTVVPSAPGDLLYYLVSGGNDDCVECELGTVSVPRPNSNPCSN